MLLLLKHKICLAHMDASLQCIITEKQSNQINTLWWYKEKDSQIVRAKENLKLSYGGHSQKQAWSTNQRFKALSQGRH